MTPDTYYVQSRMVYGREIHAVVEAKTLRVICRCDDLATALRLANLLREHPC